LFLYFSAPAAGVFFSVFAYLFNFRRLRRALVFQNVRRLRRALFFFIFVRRLRRALVF